MPRELSGFYWDEAKNRYFPLSSGSKPQAQTIPIPDFRAVSWRASDSSSSSSTLASTDRLSRKRKRGNVLWNATENLRGSMGGPQTRRRCMHDVMCSHFTSTSRAIQIPVPDSDSGTITAFKTTIVNGRSRMFYGDSHGWLYSNNNFSEANSGHTPHTPLFPMIDRRPVGRWSREIDLESSISSICISDSRCVATSFGPSCKIFVQTLESSDVFILNPDAPFMYDVWTSSLQGRNLVIGASKKAIFLKDIDNLDSVQMLATRSDVLTVEQQENLVYAGTRSGCITRFDTRLRDQGGQKLLEDVFQAQTNSVTHLKIIREWQLIVGNMNGSLGAYDLRFARGSTPLLTFSGHVNSYTSQLPLAVDPSEDFLFVAGQDKRIRAWSLQSGEALLPSQPSTSSPTPPSVFGMQFDKLVTAMQVTEEQDEICLWAASGRNLFKYYLGPGAMY